MKPLNLTGKRFGRLVAISPIKKRSHGRIVWLCECDCGRKFEAVGSDIAKGSITSCGKHRSSSTKKANDTLRNQVKEFGIVPGMLKQKKRSSNTSGYKGVTVIKLKSGKKRYQAELTAAGVPHKGPRRLTSKEAYEDRISLEEKYFSTFLDQKNEI